MDISANFIGGFVAVAGLLTTWAWNIYMNSQKSYDGLKEHLEEYIKACDEDKERKIKEATGACLNKQRDLQSEITNHKENYLLEVGKLRQEFEEKVQKIRQETLTELATRRLIDDNVIPLREELKSLKNDTKAIMQGLARIEGALNVADRRRDDNQ